MWQVDADNYNEHTSVSSAKSLHRAKVALLNSYNLKVGAA